jgi:hypothetical protein
VLKKPSQGLKRHACREKAKYTIEQVLQAREKALAVNASSVAPEEFENEQYSFAKAIAQLELG